jgi:hypothetical protein
MEVSEMTAAFDDFVSEDTAQAVAEQNLLPAGKYEGVVNKFEPREIPATTQEGLPHPLFGKSIYRVTVDLFVNGKERKHFIDVTGQKLFSRDGSRLLEPSILGVQFLKAATGKTSGSLSAALEAAKVKRLTYTLTRSEGTNGYSAKNWTKISA